jgi:hypothetical protein
MLTMDDEMEAFDELEPDEPPSIWHDPDERHKHVGGEQAPIAVRVRPRHRLGPLDQALDVVRGEGAHDHVLGAHAHLALSSTASAA